MPSSLPPRGVITHTGGCSGLAESIRKGAFTLTRVSLSLPEKLYSLDFPLSGSSCDCAFLQGRAVSQSRACVWASLGSKAHEASAAFLSGFFIRHQILLLEWEDVDLTFRVPVLHCSSCAFAGNFGHYLGTYLLARSLNGWAQKYTPQLNSSVSARNEVLRGWGKGSGGTWRIAKDGRTWCLQFCAVLAF